MNNRIMAMLFALVAAMFISIVPVKAEAACAHADNNKDCVCDYCGQKPLHNWVYEKNDTTHEKKCANPKCHETEGAVAHTLTVKNNGDGTHTASCVCGFSKTAEHKNENGDRVCDSGCGAVYHTMRKVEAKAAECEKAGNVEHYYCTICGKTFKDSFGNEVISVVATAPLAHKETVKFDEKGHQKVCEVCDAELASFFAHELEKVINEDDTHTVSCKHCEYTKTESHFDKDKTCKCDVCYVELEHTPGKAVTKNSTTDQHEIKCETCKKVLETVKCTFDYTAVEYGKGVHKYECTECGRHSIDEKCSDKMDDHYCDKCGAHMVHDPLNTTYMTRKAKSPTCEEDGIHIHYECRVCGLLLKENGSLFTESTVNPALGHKFDKSWTWVETEDGTAHFKMCANTGCKAHVYGTPENVQVGEEAHSHKNWNTSDEAHEELCAVCGEYYGYEKHNFSSVELAAASSTGTQRHKLVCECGVSVLKKCVFDENCICKICGAPKTHNWDDLAGLAGTAATCTEAGKEFAAQCPVCRGLFQKDEYGKILSISEADRVIPALGHKWVKDRADVADGKHIMKCDNAGCDKGTVMNHYTKDGDCYCDVEGCKVVAHSHKLVFVAAKPATCTADGTETYYKYEACGRMFDLEQNEIFAPLTIPATGHDTPATWTPGENGMHVKVCGDCGEIVASEAHNFQNRSVTCSVCGAEEGLTHVEAKAATCDEAGNIEYWYSKITGKKYEDAAGTELIETVAIPATGHEMSGWEDLGNGQGHKQVCLNNCGHTLTENHDNANGCFCTECGGFKNGHTNEMVEAVPATCGKAGTQAHFKCSCGKLYDLGFNAIEKAGSIAQLKHVMNTEVKKDAKLGKHYIECKNCDYKMYEEHAMVMSDPNKGNYHQRLCECGELEIETHYDKNGDKKCDVCGHSMNGSSSVKVEQHDNKTVYTGQSETVKPNKNWWWNWQQAFTPSNSGGTTATTQKTTESATTGSTASGNTGSTATQAPAAGTNNANTNAGTSSNGTTVNNSGSTTVTAPSASQTNVLIQFVNWFLGLFGF